MAGQPQAVARWAVKGGVGLACLVNGPERAWHDGQEVVSALWHWGGCPQSPSCKMCKVSDNFTRFTDGHAGVDDPGTCLETYGLRLGPATALADVNVLCEGFAIAGGDSGVGIELDPRAGGVALGSEQLPLDGVTDSEGNGPRL
eukprot:SAG22_NODE_319_length_12493_cov_33.326475_9_plen_144_part_00